MENEMSETETGLILGVVELAEELGLTPQTIRKMTRQGKIPAMAIEYESGTRFRYDLEAVLKALQFDSTWKPPRKKKWTF